MSKQSRRTTAIILITLVILIPLAITQFNRDVDLSGTALNPNIEQEGTAEPPPPPVEPPAQEQPPADPPTEVPPPPPTDVPPTPVPPTDVPPTDVPPTAVPPTDVPPTEVSPTEVPPIATTDEPVSTPEMALTPEVTPEATVDTVLTLNLAVACTLEDGVIFTVNNTGDAMLNPLDYTITYADDRASLTGTLQLGAGEQTEIHAGYGEPIFNAGDYQVPLGESCSAPGQLEGIVWNDVNGDGRYSEDELGVPAIAVRLTDADGQSVEALTAKDGRYQFSSLKPGLYTVQVKLETLPRGLEASFDGDDEVNSTAVIAVSSAETAAADFGYKPTGTLAGRVWNDTNGDGVYGEAETGIAGVTVVITGAAGQTLETQTAADGRYQVEKLLAGQYTVAVKAETLPAELQANTGANADSVAVEVAVGEVATADFGYTQAAAIDGLVWLDTDGDGLKAETETGIAAVTVLLTNPDGQAFEAQTAADGRYHFGPLAAGVYMVAVKVETLPAELKATYDTDGANDSTAAVEVASEVVTADFGYESTGSAVISGLVWLELVNFGALDGNEPGYAGAKLELVDSSGLVVATAITDENGWYRFEDLRAGEYQVRLVQKTLPQPYGITFNADSSPDLQTVVTVAAGEVVQKINFGIVGTF